LELGRRLRATIRRRATINAHRTTATPAAAPPNPRRIAMQGRHKTKGGLCASIGTEIPKMSPSNAASATHDCDVRAQPAESLLPCVPSDERHRAAISRSSGVVPTVP
jgi:hypothetical protein